MNPRRYVSRLALIVLAVIFVHRLSVGQTANATSKSGLANSSAAKKASPHSAQIFVIHKGGELIDSSALALRHGVLKKKSYMTEEVPAGPVTIEVRPILGYIQQVTYNIKWEEEDASFSSSFENGKAQDVIYSPRDSMKWRSYSGRLSEVKILPYSIDDRKRRVVNPKDSTRLEILAEPGKTYYFTVEPKDQKKGRRLLLGAALGGVPGVALARTRKWPRELEVRELSGPEAKKYLDEFKIVRERFVAAIDATGNANYSPVGEFTVREVLPICGSVLIREESTLCKSWSLFEEGEQVRRLGDLP